MRYEVSRGIDTAAADMTGAAASDARYEVSRGIDAAAADMGGARTPVLSVGFGRSPCENLIQA